MEAIDALLGYADAVTREAAPTQFDQNPQLPYPDLGVTRAAQAPTQ